MLRNETVNVSDKKYKWIIRTVLYVNWQRWELSVALTHLTSKPWPIPDLYEREGPQSYLITVNPELCIIVEVTYKEGGTDLSSSVGWNGWVSKSHETSSIKLPHTLHSVLGMEGDGMKAHTLLSVLGMEGDDMKGLVQSFQDLEITSK